MSLLYIEDDDTLNRVNIDELFDKRQRRDMKQVTIFNKILNRIQKKVIVTGKTKRNEQFVWFTVPEYIFGEPVYDKGECIGYLISKLEENGFHIKYMHPNTLFVSWEHWVPSYMRTELKKKRGILVDEHGNIIDKVEQSNDINSTILNDRNAPPGAKKDQKQYTPIGSYRPTGNLVYNQDILETLEKKVVR